MHLKELNHRSPLRILERSVHGGLGAGNVGVVAARAGVGKSGFLTCVGLDDMLRGRKVLHVTTDRTVGHVRDFYDEMFTDLARASNLEETVVARRTMEENRFIYSFVGQHFSAARLAETVTILRNAACFEPKLVLLDGHAFETSGPDDVAALAELARSLDAEVWIALRTTRQDVSEDWHELPAPVTRLGNTVSVVVYLQPTEDAVHVRLLKDHDQPQVEDPGLVLDPQTFLVRES